MRKNNIMDYMTKIEGYLAEEIAQWEKAMWEYEKANCEYKLIKVEQKEQGVFYDDDAKIERYTKKIEVLEKCLVYCDECLADADRVAFLGREHFQKRRDAVLRRIERYTIYRRELLDKKEGAVKMDLQLLASPINLMDLGKKQMDRGVVVDATPAVSTGNRMDARTATNLRLYEMAMETYENVAKNNGKIIDNQMLNNTRLENYRYSISNDRLYIVDRSDEKIIYGSVAFGNTKLKPTKTEMFVQFNIAQKVCCPVLGKTCKNCYADKFVCKIVSAQTNKLSTVGNSRVRNTVLTQFENFVEIMNGAIDYIKASTNKKVVFRWHESGDVYSKRYFQKIKQVMDENKDVDFMMYTRVPFVAKEIKALNKNEHIMVRFSVDASTPVGLFDFIMKNDIPTFITIDKKDLNFAMMVEQFFPTGIICNVKKPNGNTPELYKSSELHCLKCGKCRNKNIIHLYVVIH